MIFKYRLSLVDCINSREEKEMKKMIVALFVCLLVLGSYAPSQAYEVLNGPSQLIQYNASKAYEGYTLFTPPGKTTYLIDMLGNVVHKWDLPEEGYMRLTEKGKLIGIIKVPFPKIQNKAMAIGGWGGGLMEVDWDGKVTWRWDCNTATNLQHHDFKVLPNGNVLTNIWEQIPYDEAIKAGRRADQTIKKGVVADAIYEVNRAGKVVWKWRSWDHRGANAADKLDVNFVNYLIPEYEHENQDWTHFNNLDYNPASDQVLFDSREFSEIYIVDHKTGKMIFRWGNPSAYGAGAPPTFSTPGDQVLFGPHHAQWIKPGLPGEGNILIFNNGWGRPPVSYSSIVEMDPKTGKIVWEYKALAEVSFAAHHISSADRLPNGNTMICSGNFGHMFEVTKEGEIVWEYINPVTAKKGAQAWLEDTLAFPSGPKGDGNNMVFRAHRYGPDFPGLKGKDLTPKGQIVPDPKSGWKPKVDLAGATQPGVKNWKKDWSIK